MGKRGGQRQFSKVVWPGFSYRPSPRHIKKVGRNDPCPCGSAKKYKDCHEAAGETFLAQLAQAEDRQRLRELREELKRKGVPWYRRFFFRL